MRLLRFCQSFARNSAVGRLHLPRGATKHNFHHGNGGNSSNRRYFSGIAGAGGGAILSLSFFEKSKEQKTSVDAVDDNLMQIREADLYFEAALIDNAYNVLRRWGQRIFDFNILALTKWSFFKIIRPPGTIAKK